MFKPMRFYLTPASIPQVVAYIQKYLEDNPIVSAETVQEIIREAIQEDPDLFNGSIIPIDGTSDQSIKDYIDSLPTVDAYTKAEINALLAAKQDNLTFDTTPTADSLNPVTSGGIDTALDLKADKADTYTKTQTDTALDLKADKSDTYTKTQTDNLLTMKADKADTYTKTQTDNLLDTKQNLLTFDATPTHDSTNPVTSNGILNSLTTLNESIGEQLALKPSTSEMNAALAMKENVITPSFGGLDFTAAFKAYISSAYELRFEKYGKMVIITGVFNPTSDIPLNTNMFEMSEHPPANTNVFFIGASESHIARFKIASSSTGLVAVNENVITSNQYYTFQCIYIIA